MQIYWFFPHDMNAAAPLVKLKMAHGWHLLPQSDYISSKARQQFKNMEEKDSSLCLSSLSSHQLDLRLCTRVSCSSSFSHGETKTRSDFLISGTLLLSIFVLRILSDSSRTGILDALHLRHFFIWDTAHCVRVPTFVSAFFSPSYFNNNNSNNNLPSSHPGCFTFWLILKSIYKIV